MRFAKIFQQSTGLRPTYHIVDEQNNVIGISKISLMFAWGLKLVFNEDYQIKERIEYRIFDNIANLFKMLLGLPFKIMHLKNNETNSDMGRVFFEKRSLAKRAGQYTIQHNKNNYEGYRVYRGKLGEALTIVKDGKTCAMAVRPYKRTNLLNNYVICAVDDVLMQLAIDFVMYFELARGDNFGKMANSKETLFRYSSKERLKHFDEEFWNNMLAQMQNMHEVSWFTES